MNNRDIVDDEYQFSSVGDRYKGFTRRTKNASGDYEFELAEELNGSKTAIISSTRWNERDATSSIDEIFLERQTRAGNWIAAPWKPADNPWIVNGLPTVGETLTGSIVDFAGPLVAIAQTKVNGKTLEFAIRRENLPTLYASMDIRDCLFVGDLVSGRLMPIDLKRLRMNIDVKTWLETVHRTWRTSAFYTPETKDSNDQTGPDDSLETTEHLNGSHILLIEDEDDLANSLRIYLEGKGAHIDRADVSQSHLALQEVTEKLRSKYDGIILDYQLEIEPEIQKSIFDLIRKYRDSHSNVSVLVLSGNLDSAPIFSERQRFGYLAKPFSPSSIVRWFLNPDPHKISTAESKTRITSALFSVENTTKHVIQKTNKLLEKLVKRHDLSGALWFLESTPGRYELRASSKDLEGVISPAILGRLGRSIISTCINQRRALSNVLSKNDPLYEAFQRKRFRYRQEVQYFCFPILVRGLAPRAIIFFSWNPIGVSVRRSIMDRQDHFELLMETISQSDAIDEISASATSGRMALGTLHDLRTELATLSFVLDSDLDESQKVSYFEKIVPRARDVSVSQLRGFRPNQKEIFDLSVMIEQICTPLKKYIRDEYEERPVELITDLEEIKGVKLSVDPNPLARTLVNLIDNAAAFTQRSSLSKIWVSAKLSQIDPDRNVEISVMDTGPGLSVVERLGMFMPRSTSRPDSSTGLGLYLSKTLLAGVDGTIECQVRPRWAGSRFVVRLPHELGFSS